MWSPSEIMRRIKGWTSSKLFEEVVMKPHRSPFAGALKAVAIAVGLSLVPVNEVDSGVSYGGGIALDFNGNVSIGGHILSTDKANALMGKVGLNYILNGQDKGDLSLRLGGGYVFTNGIAPSIEGSITPTSASPFSIGAGIGLSSVKEDKRNGDVNGEAGEEPFECIGGTLVGERDCKCPEGTLRGTFPGGIECTKPL